MFLGIYSHPEWKSNHKSSLRPCLFRDAADGYVEVFPCSTNSQDDEHITLAANKDTGLLRETNVLLDERYRQFIPYVWVKTIQEVPDYVEDLILYWEREHTV